MKLRAAIAVAALLTPTMSMALTLDFPAVASVIAERIVPQDSYFLPLARFRTARLMALPPRGRFTNNPGKSARAG